MFEDGDEDSSQVEWIGRFSRLTESQFSGVVTAVFKAMLAADATRARLSQSAQDVLGGKLPESFFDEVYPQNLAMYETTFPREVAEIRSAVGLANPDLWDFCNMTDEQLIDANPKTLQLKEFNGDQSVLPSGNGSRLG